MLAPLVTTVPQREEVFKADIPLGQEIAIDVPGSEDWGLTSLVFSLAVANSGSARPIVIAIKGPVKNSAGDRDTLYTFRKAVNSKINATNPFIIFDFGFFGSGIIIENTDALYEASVGDEVIIPAGGQIGTTTTNLVVGDQFTGVRLNVKKYAARL